jgi:hypothetical protein
MRYLLLSSTTTVMCARRLRSSSRAHGAGHEALPHAGVADLHALDVEIVHVDALGILGVRHRRPQRLGDEIGGALRRELERIQRLFHAFAANLIDDEADFSRRKADESCDGASFHGYDAALGGGAPGAAPGAARGAAPGAAGGAPATPSFASPLRSPECI